MGERVQEYVLCGDVDLVQAPFEAAAVVMLLQYRQMRLFTTGFSPQAPSICAVELKKDPFSVDDCGRQPTESVILCDGKEIR